ncbi:MAG: BrnT family toxin [Treponema sp.]|jgi:uncharacterized DUF497 family protein|nr:BrnT family toxin [Treponema sp.]
MYPLVVEYLGGGVTAPLISTLQKGVSVERPEQEITNPLKAETLAAQMYPDAIWLDIAPGIHLAASRNPHSMEEKNQTNKKKHGFYVSDITDVFEDTHALECYDDGHSFTEEDRYIFIGRFTESVIWTVIFEDRGEACYLLSAREATPKEEDAYHEHYQREHS